MEMNAAPSLAALSEKDRGIVTRALAGHVTALTQKAKQLRDLGEEDVAKGLELKCVYINERIAPAFTDQLGLNLGVHDKDAAAGEARRPEAQPGTDIVHKRKPFGLLKAGKKGPKKKR